MQYECVAVGAFERCEDREDCARTWEAHCDMLGVPAFSEEQAYHLCTIQPGDWVLTKPRVAIDTGINGLYIIRQDDVVATFEDSLTVAAS